MWQDRRTVDLCEKLSVHNKTVYNKTGLKISPVFSAVKMTWFKEHRNDLYNQVYKFMGIQDYLLMLMTGKFVTDRSLGSRTNLLNLKTQDWDDELIELFGIRRDQLCDLVDPGAICGTLQQTLAQITGLSTEIPIISAGGDQQCAALGLGVIEEGDLEVNTGTGGYVIGSSNEPILDDDMRIFCNVSAIPGKYITEASILTSGTIYRWFNKEFYTLDTGEATTYDRINQDAASTPPGSNGLILIPHLKGSGAPYWNPKAKGYFYNLSLTTTRGDMARAILEGIVTEIANNMSLIESLTKPVKKVSVAGGLTNFSVYNQIQADTYNREVCCYDNGEATALGAFISASVTTGVYTDYKQAFKVATKHLQIKTYKPHSENTNVYNDIIIKKAALYASIISGESI